MYCWIFTVITIFSFFIPKTALAQGLMVFFVGDSDVYTCRKALSSIDLPGLKVLVLTEKDLDAPRASAVLSSMDVAVLDAMQGGLTDWLTSHKNLINPMAKIYAVRSPGRSRELKGQGVIFDETVRRYFDYTSEENIRGLILYLAKTDLGVHVSPPAPVVPPEGGFYHPDAHAFFADVGEYVNWYKKTGHFNDKGLWSLVVVFPTFTVDSRKGPLDALIRAYEANGINTLTLLYSPKDGPSEIDRLISEPPLNDALGSITSFVFRFSSLLSPRLLKVLEKANCPVFNPQYLFYTSRDEWMKSSQGMAASEITMQFSMPELSGLVEPTVVGAKEDMSNEGPIYVPIKDEIDILARRVARWHALKEKPNRDKRIVLIYYNHVQGKQNIGASYLNVARSIKVIVNRLRAEGYMIPKDVSEDEIKDLLVKVGRNIGSWAPGELDRFMASNDYVAIDMRQYKRWIKGIDQGFLKKVEKDWGRPEDSKIMTRDGRFIIPCIRLGNLTIAPQPVRGFSDDPDKLYHSTIVYPHHQYVAFYLWLQKVLRPDAMISLGTHGTHEWLPGKNAGLSASCSPEVLIGDIPNIYPYIVDDVGEGIQAKRRGRAVIIDHAVPPFRQGGLYAEYSKLAALISEYEASDSNDIKAARLARIGKLATALGLCKDLGVKKIDKDSVKRLEDYLIEIKTSLVPYGLHTFGESPKGEALDEMAAAVSSGANGGKDRYLRLISESGRDELDALVNALNGGFIPPAPGGDPVRNPESLPTGRDFYGFDPEKVPSKEAWGQGKKAAEEIIDGYRKAHGGRYPEKTAIVLWAVETMRNEGVNEATALYLMGMRPIWDRRDKVKGVEPISATELNRPRLDVLLQMSGLYRDTFPSVALLLDKAVKEAAVLTDVENYIKDHTEALKKTLIKAGYTRAEADKLSTVRIFSERPGAYGTKVAEMTGASGLWEDDSKIAQAFMNMVSFGYSKDMWGQDAKAVFRSQLKDVSVTVQSRSSNLYGLMDNDDVFQYLGGLNMAVKKISGKAPDSLISDQKDPRNSRMEPLSLAIGTELRARYLNPVWIEGMKKEGYAGAREMSRFVDNMWGWQVTTPEMIDRAKWDEVYSVYVEDKYRLGLKEFFSRENPWAYQSITGRMLEAARKGYWKADDRTLMRLSKEYALDVINKGVACCDHTCNNPLLNQMVVNIISIPGVMAPKLVERFKLAIQKATGKTIDAQVKQRIDLLTRLGNRAILVSDERPSYDPWVKARATIGETTGNDKGGVGTEGIKGTHSIQNASKKADVKGYKVKELGQRDKKERADKADVSSSGVQWAAAVFVMGIVVLVVLGIYRQKRR
ncbi:MAG: cobaltochelatase subunit CobN [Dissulfurimicrobium sp.]|uniref:cobaltochelatase subunit CobN n=1 Tax=Dissulfurimicrobium TaxID=1769732 RepID=UPI003C70ECD0